MMREVPLEEVRQLGVPVSSASGATSAPAPPPELAGAAGPGGAGPSSATLQGEDPGEAGQQVASLWSWVPAWLGGSSPADAEQAVQDAYRRDLEAATRDDFRDLDELAFLRLADRDRAGRPLVVVTARHFPAVAVEPERLYRYLILTLDSVAQDPFSVLYVHTGATYWENSPGIPWLRATWARLPARYHAHLAQVWVLHADLALSAALWAACPWLAPDLWPRLSFVLRLEFLEDDMDLAALELPRFVAEHDAELEGQPLADYGMYASSEQVAAAGLPPPVAMGT